MYTIEDKLGFIATTARAIQADLKAAPDREAIVELLKACQSIDERFKEFCEQCDSQDGLEPGTTYREGGACSEFYIESSEWEDVSEQLRKLLPKTEKIQDKN